MTAVLSTLGGASGMASRRSHVHDPYAQTRTVTVDDAARLVCRSPLTIRRWIAQRRLVAVRGHMREADVLRVDAETRAARNTPRGITKRKAS